MAGAPDEPEADVILTGLSDRSVIVKVSYSDDLAKGENVIRPLRTIAKFVSDTVHRGLRRDARRR